MTLDDLRVLIGRECVRLAKLGSTWSIAQELHSRGICGRKDDNENCPLARAICDTLLCSPGRLRIGRKEARWGAHWMCAFQEDLLILAEFVRQVDMGLFPQLIEEAAL
jgi:hypothetical protein